jgi:hypothetical protein
MVKEKKENKEKITYTKPKIKKYPLIQQTTGYTIYYYGS